MEHLLHMVLGKVKRLISVLLSWVISGTNRTPLPLPDRSGLDPGSKCFSDVISWQLKMTELDPTTILSLSCSAPRLVTPLCQCESSSDLAVGCFGELTWAGSQPGKKCDDLNCYRSMTRAHGVPQCDHKQQIPLHSHLRQEGSVLWRTENLCEHL